MYLRKSWNSYESAKNHSKYRIMAKRNSYFRQKQGSRNKAQVGITKERQVPCPFWKLNFIIFSRLKLLPV